MLPIIPLPNFNLLIFEPNSNAGLSENALLGIPIFPKSTPVYFVWLANAVAAASSLSSDELAEVKYSVHSGLSGDK
jgi:hypothetical protein